MAASTANSTKTTPPRDGAGGGSISGVAVVASSTYAARMGREALTVEWNEDKAEKRGSAAIAASFRDIVAGKGPADLKWEGFDSKGDAAAINAAKAGPKVLEATYEFPYLAHATMEPMNATAVWTADKCEVWCPTQNGEAALSAASAAAGLPLRRPV